MSYLPIFLPVSQKPGLYFSSSRQPQIKALSVTPCYLRLESIAVQGHFPLLMVPVLRVLSPISRVEREF